MVTNLYTLENFNEIFEQVFHIIRTAAFKDNQIICQTRVPNSRDWHTGIGRISDLEEKDETKYCYLNPELKGTPIGNLIEKHRAFRTRIMAMIPKACYSIHQDPSKRIHVPIRTNPSAWMAWPLNNHMCHMPTGSVYLTDTTLPHTFFNAGTEARIHLVMGVDFEE